MRRDVAQLIHVLDYARLSAKGSEVEQDTFGEVVRGFSGIEVYFYTVIYAAGAPFSI